LFDFSTAEAHGLLEALQCYLGLDKRRWKFDDIIKGCYVHWLRSAERVAKLVCESEEELESFKKSCAVMRFSLRDENAATCWFDMMVELYPGLKNWANWWCRDSNGLHLKLRIKSNP